MLGWDRHGHLSSPAHTARACVREHGARAPDLARGFQVRKGLMTARTRESATVGLFWALVGARPAAADGALYAEAQQVHRKRGSGGRMPSQPLRRWLLAPPAAMGGTADPMHHGCAMEHTASRQFRVWVAVQVDASHASGMDLGGASSCRHLAGDPKA